MITPRTWIAGLDVIYHETPESWAHDIYYGPGSYWWIDVYLPNAVLRLLADRRRRIGEDRTRMVGQLHVFLLRLFPGGAKKDLSAAQARKLLAGVRPKDVAGKTRKRRAGARSRPASSTAPCPAISSPAQGRLREDTGETTLTPARSARIPTPALRTSHFPDPPLPSLEPRDGRLLDTEGSQMRAISPSADDA
jgi:hypothetical protein